MQIVAESRYFDVLVCELQLWSVPTNEEVNLVEREVPLEPVRVASVFADKIKDEFDDGDTSLLEKVKIVSNANVIFN